MSRSWAGGSTWAWRRTRAQILARDGHRCRLNLDGCTTVATEAHHLDGKAAGDNPDRIIAACSNCNKKAGDPRRHDPPPRTTKQW